MRLQILSDIHLEFGERKFELDNPDLLILAGDIHLGTKGINWIRELINQIPVIYILGNHEYYKNSYPKLIRKLKDSAENTNIHILENDSVEFNGITFHGATLWTNFELYGDPRIAGFECQQKMNDYNLIKRDPSYSKLRSIDTHVIHNESIKWLEKSLIESKTEFNVVVTHHAPSEKSILDKYKNDLVSAGFTSNLDGFIEKTQPDLWIHGHVHACFDYSIGKTRIVCNSRGYPGEEVEGYQDKKVIKIGA
jgi:Icc-related predicted phosphoesterase